MSTEKNKLKNHSRFLVVFIILSLIGGILFVRFFRKAFVGTTIPLKIEKSEAISTARGFLEQMKYDPEGYKICVTFETDNEVDFYLQRRLGIEKVNNLVKNNQVCLHYWRIRFFRPLEKEEFVVGIVPNGDFDGFKHTLSEDSPGASLSQAQALEIARVFTETVGKIDLSSYTLSSTSIEENEHRLDYSFKWKRQWTDLLETNEEIMILVQGDKVGFFEKYLDVPEAFIREFQNERSIANSIYTFSSILSVALTLCALVVFLSRLLNRQELKWRFGVILSVIVGVIVALLTINNFHLVLRDYSTSSGWLSFVTYKLLLTLAGICLIGVQVFLCGTTGKTLDNEVFTRGICPESSKKGSSFKVLMFQCGIGYCLAFLFLGYHTIFYLVGNQIGIWAPAKPKFSNFLLAYIPFLTVLGSGLYAALTEETVFRIFCIPFFKKYAKNMWVALIIPALVWGMAHSSQIVYPVYTRVIEVGIVGVIYGIFFIRYGFIAVLVAHYLVDSIASTMIFMDSAMPSYRIIMIIAVLMPVLVVLLFAWLRTAILRSSPKPGLAA